jgi:YHS domain-containing protein
MNPLRRKIAAFALVLPFAAAASEVNNVEGLALEGHDPVAYFTSGKAEQGLATLPFEHGGVTYRFSTTANRDAFRADPARYLPQYDGYCAFGVSRGYKAAIDPTSFTIVDGKLYLNYNAAVQRDWLKDAPGYIRAADARWGEVRATTRVIR